MAWTSPRTWADPEVVTAALLNTHVRDNTTFLHNRLQQIVGTGGSVAMTASGTYYTGASISVPAGAWLVIAAMQLSADSSTDSLKVRLRNTTDSSTAVEVQSQQGGSHSKQAITPAVYVSLAGTKTIEAQADNTSAGGASVIDSTVLIAIGSAA